MCGIIGYIGKIDAAQILLKGLKDLEYLVYDSAGLVVHSPEALQVVRTPGKIVELEKAMGGKEYPGTMGVGHTRWATHGEPNKVNTHPHLSFDGKFAVVHNGIIEYYMTLKNKLMQKGIEFKSDTDSEVVAHLIAHLYKGDVGKAVVQALNMLQGAFGLGIVSLDNPEMLIGARRGSPLLVGIAKDDLFLSSDVAAVIGHTSKVVYLDDNDVVFMRNDGSHRIVNLHSQEVQREVEEVEFSVEHVEKGGFDHFMLKEIFEQPDSIRNCTRGRLLINEGTAKLSGLATNIKELRSIDRIIITACGTSYYAGMVGEYMIEELAGIPVEVEYASEFRYRNPVIGPNTIVLAISQSGETADTLAALKESQRRGATALGICNGVVSTLARESDGGVYLHVGPEIGVASTKAFTAQVSVLAMIALLLGRMRRVSFEQGVEIAQAMQELPAKVQEILKLNDRIKDIASRFTNAPNFLYLGRHYNYPVAMEGALKLKEISYIHAEGYPAAEIKHGPIALIDENMPVVAVAPKDALFEKVLSNIQEIKARKARVIVVTTEANEHLEQFTDEVIVIPSTLSMLMPILTCIPLQLLAYHIAVLRGNNVDQPRNLTKSVMVE